MSARAGYDPEFHEAAPKKRPGPRYILVKILTTLAILMVLIALLLPFRRTAGEAARRSQCVNNLKQIGLALHNYEQEHGAFPPAYTVDARGRPLHSWRVLILPYLEQTALYNAIDLSKPWNDPANAQARETAPNVYRCPSEATPKDRTTYLANVGPNGCFLPTGPRRLAEIVDGTASTLMVIEAGAANAVPWMALRDADESLVLGLVPDAKLPHAGGMNALFVDGSVQFLKASIPAGVRRAMMSIAGNDPIPPDQL